MFEIINRNLQRIYYFLRINSIVFNSFLRNIIQNKNYNFIKIGANDGKTGDPIFYLINLFSLKGILVEPVPYVFKKLEYNYRKNKNVFLENSAISKDEACSVISFLSEKNYSLYRTVDDLLFYK